MVRRIAVVFILLIMLSVPVHAAREIELVTEGALIVTGSEGEQVFRIPDAFTFFSEEYTLSGASGRYDQANDLMESIGSAETPAVLSRGGDDAFSVSATDRIEIAFERENLTAEGAVRYTSDEVEATCVRLTVDRPEAIEGLLKPLIEQIANEETKAFILDFLSGAGADDRLVLLEQDVHVIRGDSTMTAGWVVFNEARPDELVSVADPDKGLKLNLVVDENDDESQSADE